MGTKREEYRLRGGDILEIREFHDGRYGAPGRSVCGVDPERITERIRKRRMKKERLTVKNPDGTYRIWMERAGTFRLESQMDSVFAYGDLVNKLGRYEDQDEEKHKK